MSIARRTAGTLVATAAILLIGGLSRVPWSPAGSDAGLLRLSWRLRGERIETCRARTPDELAALPVHMRTPEACETRLVAYRLTTVIDDDVPDTARAIPGGARGDRPLFVLREATLRPGPHRIRVRFEPEDATAASLPPLVLDTVLEAAPGRIELITIDPGAHRLVHHRGGAR